MSDSNIKFVSTAGNPFITFITFMAIMVILFVNGLMLALKSSIASKMSTRNGKIAITLNTCT